MIGPSRMFCRTGRNVYLSHCCSRYILNSIFENVVRLESCFASGTQSRSYTPPSKRTWSKQHSVIKTPRPLTDVFNLGKLHPTKQWWKERKKKPETFMGFPDVGKAEKVGGSMYIDKMDPVTLSVVLDKCAYEGIHDASILAKLCWQCQQIANKTMEPSLSYIYKSMSNLDWYDHHFMTTYLARIERRLHMFSLLDCANILLAMSNPKFSNQRVLQRVLEHTELLLVNRDDFDGNSLVLLLSGIRALLSSNQISSNIVEATVHHLAHCKLEDSASMSELCDVLYTLAVIKHRRPDLPWRIVRIFLTRFERDDNKSKDKRPVIDSFIKETEFLNNLGGDDLARLVYSLGELGITRTRLVGRVSKMLEEARFTLTGRDACVAVYGLSRLNDYSSGVYEQMAKVVREEAGSLSGNDMVLAIYGFSRARREYGTLLRYMLPRVSPFLGGLPISSLAILYDALGKAFRSVSTAEVFMADDARATGRLNEEFSLPLGSLKESLANVCEKTLLFIHKRMSEATHRELAKIARCAVLLQPENDGFTEDLLKYCFKSLNLMEDNHLGMLFLFLGSQENLTDTVKNSYMTKLIAHAYRKWTSEGGVLHPSCYKTKQAAIILVQTLRGLTRCDPKLVSPYTKTFIHDICTSLSSSLEYVPPNTLALLPSVTCSLSCSNRPFVMRLDHFLNMKRYDMSPKHVEKAFRSLTALWQLSNLENTKAAELVVAEDDAASGERRNTLARNAEFYNELFGTLSFTDETPCLLHASSYDDDSAVGGSDVPDPSNPVLEEFN